MTQKSIGYRLRRWWHFLLVRAGIRSPLDARSGIYYGDDLRDGFIRAMDEQEKGRRK